MSPQRKNKRLDSYSTSEYNAPVFGVFKIIKRCRSYLPIIIRSVVFMAITKLLLTSCWNLLYTFKVIWGYRSLICQLTKRDFIQRYKGSCLGLVWTLITPILFLLIYMFVFNVVMKARWGISPNEGPMEFALGLFCGLILWGIFSGGGRMGLFLLYL